MNVSIYFIDGQTANTNNILQVSGYHINYIYLLN